MAKLGGYILEYFFGTDTHKYYNQRRSFQREFFSGNELKKQLKRLDEEEFSEIAIGKVTCNIISLASIASCALAKSYLYFLFLSEGSRCVLSFMSNYARKSRSSTEKTRQEIYQLRKKQEDDEGEEWKNLDHYNLKRELEDIMGE